MRRSPALRRIVAPLATLLLATPLATAAPPAAELLPIDTVGCFTIDNTPDFLDRWSRTQFGKLAADPMMRPFRDQIEKRFNGRFGGIEERLGVTLDDLRSTAAGEATIAMVATGDKQQPGHIAVIIDATGREAEVEAVLGKIDKRLVERGATRGETPDGLTTYRLPPDEKADLPERTAAVFHAVERLVVAEDAQLAGEILTRVRGGSDGQTLSEREAYAETQRRARLSAGSAETHLKWFIDPFEYNRAALEPVQPGDLPEKKDMVETLAGQGFDAIRGVGGLVAVAASPSHDFEHHTFASAPPKRGSKEQPAAEKYDLAMRMLDLPNDAEPLSGSAPPVELWAPRQVATYKLVHLKLKNAFEHLDTLFDAVAGYSDAFEKMLAGFEKDPYGPKINIREEVIPYLGERVVIMTDYTLPITPDCERYLIAVDVTDLEALRSPIDRWLENDGAERKELDGVPYWEMVPQEELLVDDSELDLLELDEPDPRPAKAERNERVLRRAAVCLHKGRLVIGSDADFLRQALFGVAAGESLAESYDLRAAIESLASLAPGERCAWNFTRNDESLRPTYELLREGRMPEAQTFFGRFLNRVLTTDEEREFDAVREQKVDGSTLPSFELARRYFGPSARSVRNEDDGWLITGVVLSKAAPADSDSSRVARVGRR